MKARQSPYVAAGAAALLGMAIGLALRGVEPAATWKRGDCGGHPSPPQAWERMYPDRSTAAT